MSTIEQLTKDVSHLGGLVRSHEASVAEFQRVLSEVKAHGKRFEEGRVSLQTAANEMRSEVARVREERAGYGECRSAAKAATEAAALASRECVALASAYQQSESGALAKRVDGMARTVDELAMAQEDLPRLAIRLDRLERGESGPASTLSGIVLRLQALEDQVESDEESGAGDLLQRAYDMLSEPALRATLRASGREARAEHGELIDDLAEWLREHQ